MTTTVPEPYGCLWPLDPACLNEEWEGEYDEAEQLRAQALASGTLRRLTAYRVGGCPVVVRPCATACNDFPYRPGSDMGFLPVNWAGTWSNCACVGPCRHNPRTGLRLPPPVYSIVEVKVDGAVVDPTDYWLSEGYLIALNGREWPTTQNLDLPDTETGTFSVTYLNTAPVDGNGAYAAAKLAIQYARACKGGTCDLPETVTSIVRQGVSYDLPAGSFPNGETGIREVDAFIAIWNPNHRLMRPRVWVP